MSPQPLQYLEVGKGDSKRHQGVAIVPWHLGNQEKTFKKVSVLSNTAEGSCSVNCALAIGFCVVEVFGYFGKTLLMN